MPDDMFAIMTAYFAATFALIIVMAQGCTRAAVQQIKEFIRPGSTTQARRRGMLGISKPSSKPGRPFGKPMGREEAVALREGVQRLQACFDETKAAVRNCAGARAVYRKLAPLMRERGSFRIAGVAFDADGHSGEDPTLDVLRENAREAASCGVEEVKRFLAEQRPSAGVLAMQMAFELVAQACEGCPAASLGASLKPAGDPDTDGCRALELLAGIGAL